MLQTMATAFNSDRVKAVAKKTKDLAGKRKKGEKSVNWVSRRMKGFSGRGGEHRRVLYGILEGRRMVVLGVSPVCL